MDQMRWRRSSFSGGEGGGNDNCVEIALTADTAAVRDSKNTSGPVLALPVAAVTALVGHLS